MEMFVLNDEITRLEMLLPELSGKEHLHTLVTLAWYLRQQNTQRALQLADQAQALAEKCDLNSQEIAALSARLQLIRAKAKWLFAELELAFEMALPALEEFIRLQDWIGISDSRWLLGTIANEQGKIAERDQEWQQAEYAAGQAADSLRLGLTQSTMAVCAAFHDPAAAKTAWSERLSLDQPNLHPALRAVFNQFWAVIAVQESDFERSINCWIQAYEIAIWIGQKRLLLSAVLNVGDNFNSLNDHHSALEWMQRGLDLARPTGWPIVIGSCLMQIGETLRRLGRLQAAHEFLSEALTVLAPLANSRNYAVALAYIADLYLDRNDYENAYTYFKRLQQQAQDLKQIDFQSVAARGQAHALLQLQQPQRARDAALAALALAQKKRDGTLQIAALKVLAEIHAKHILPAPIGVDANNLQLYYLQQAQQVAATIEGYTISGDLLDALADAYAAIDDYDQAYALTQQANASRQKTHSQKATNRAIAMQVRLQAKRAQDEGEYHRQLAQSEAQRAVALQQSSAMLEHLSAIGQEITAHLNIDALFQTMNRHVFDLFDSCYMCIYLTEPDGQGLYSAFGVENGQAVSYHRVALSSTNSNAARCVRERREILIDLDPQDEDPTLIPGTLPTLTRLFAPLMIDEQILGVITIQSLTRHAYGERERMIFRTLCAYGAIALDNASAYRQLQETQAKLVAQEKLAALGGLVAGVAHELNTPIGNSLLMISALQEKTEILEEKLNQQHLRQSDLSQYLIDAQDSADLILRALTTSADLVSSFKQVAVDRASAQRRLYNLQQTSHEVIATLMNQIRLSGHSIELEIPEYIEMDSYPGPYGQIITNLINNSLLHGFDGKSSGQIRLCARIHTAKRVLIQFSDNGVGIAEQNLKRIFEPFFSTKIGQGDSGLGLSIIYNIVTSLLNGKIQVESQIGNGTTFTLDLPLAPEYC